MKAQILTVIGVVALSVSASGQLANPSFEDPVTSDGPPFVGSWEAFVGPGAASSANSTVMPRTGLQSLEVSILGTDNSFAGAFQDVPGLTSGLAYTFAGWHATLSTPLDLGVEVRIEWRDSVNNTEVSRTPNFVPIPGAAYSPFSLTAEAPAGADLARVVYAIQTFGLEPSNTGIVYVDDMSFTLVPEPSTAALLTVGVAGWFATRRRWKM